LAGAGCYEVYSGKHGLGFLLEVEVAQRLIFIIYSHQIKEIKAVTGKIQMSLYAE